MLKTPISPETKSSRGFSLMEVVVVLVLLGILSAVAIARVVDHGADVRAAADTLKVHLRHAQGRAMNSDAPWGVNFSSNTYTLYTFDDTNTKRSVFFPGENSATVQLGSGITISDLGGVTTISFDGWGLPYDDEYINPDPGDSLNSDLDFTLTNGKHSQTITVHQDTGYIP